MSYNVHGLNSPYKRSLLWRDVLKTQADVIFLQETHLTLPNASWLKHKLFPHIFLASLDSKPNADTAILIKHSVAFIPLGTLLDPKGHNIILKCLLCSSPYTLVSLYAPNTRQLSFLRSVIKIAKLMSHTYGCNPSSMRRNSMIYGDINKLINVIIPTTYWHVSHR